MAFTLKYLDFSWFAVMVFLLFFIFLIIKTSDGRDNFIGVAILSLMMIGAIYRDAFIIKINPYEAKNHLFKDARVCGDVVLGTYASGSRGQPTFLNLEKKYPNHIFSIVIWGPNRRNFSRNPESYYLNKNVCVDGWIDEYGGIPQIEAYNEKDITIND